MNSTFERVLREFAHLGPELISADPPVLLFHSFLSAEEADAFIAHGKGKYTESRGVGVDSEGRMTDVKTEIRTSSHTWCQEAECLDDPLVQRVTARVSDVTRTPLANGEFAQLVYYNSCPEPSHPSCAFYRRHSDFIAGDVHRNQGVRIYTVFMYLNDVEEGGGTRFTDLPSGQITTEARRGKAIFWPSVLADAPYTVDPRTHHEALPVTRGEKYGARGHSATSSPHPTIHLPDAVLARARGMLPRPHPPLSAAAARRREHMDSPVRLQDALRQGLHDELIPR